MDYKRREEIFSKDYISTRELQELLGYTNISSASNKMGEIKEVTGDRLKVKGRIHTEDYFAYFKVFPDDRYNRLTANRELSENEVKEYSPLKARPEQTVSEPVKTEEQTEKTD